MTELVAQETVPIPASYLDLLTRPICGVLTTMGDDGQPQSSLVWVDHDHERACINTTFERQNARNMLANRKVSLLVVDPDDVGSATSRSGATPSSSPTMHLSTSMA